MERVCACVCVRERECVCERHTVVRARARGARARARVGGGHVNDRNFLRTTTRCTRIDYWYCLRTLRTKLCLWLLACCEKENTILRYMHIYT